MRQFIYDSWNSVMNYDYNPLKNIPDLNTRHMVMQVLAWMWCITFSMYFSSMWIFGATAIAHILLLSAIVLTVSTFEVAKNRPSFFIKKGYHTTSRSRQVMYLTGNGKLQKIKLDPNDPGGEHE
tara:strand:- start:374 stop:745 length:372 start_codon:yes stop_codon:yes gene_type:complete